ncbi:MAG: type II toxin-antitoxin system RelB/DinJ family antitoxin [Streptococcaceae bacterium]|jgi:addiction module RelB/DinJ family antitoxin|nr:type II toxin-antitoxin system RelB/DinJ family antitoxin [Streptococcaceae bacterium]
MINMTEKNDRIAFRTNKDLKERATVILAKNQLDLSTALNMFLGKIVNDETVPLDFRTDEQKAAELAFIEKHLDAAIERRKNGTAVYYTLEELEQHLNDDLYKVAEPQAEYQVDDKD